MTMAPSHVALLWGNPDVQSLALVKEIHALLARRGVRASFEAAAAAAAGLAGNDAHPLEAICEQADFAIVIGNDRAVLRYARQIACHGIPLVGINQDRLGFLGALAPGDAVASIARMLDGDHEVEARAMLAARVERDGVQIFLEHALNDIVVNHAGQSRLMDLRVHVDGEHAFDLRADGVVIATPTGSTAYCMSTGGPVLHREVKAWSLSPVAPHTLSVRPFVLPLGSSISIRALGGRAAAVNADGIAAIEMHPGDVLQLALSPISARFAHPRGWSYFDTLRRKLGWSAGEPDDA